MIEESDPSYYAIIPATVRYDKSICPNAKLLYGEITALCNKNGYCWASNSYFAELYKVSNVSISKWIKKLTDAHYIYYRVIYKKDSKEVDKRIIILAVASDRLKQMFNTPINKSLQGYELKLMGAIKEMFKDIITYNNNTYNSLISSTDVDERGQQNSLFNSEIKGYPPVSESPQDKKQKKKQGFKYWKEFIDIYHKFMLEKIKTPPVYGPGNLKGAKEIVEYLKTVVLLRFKEKNIESDEEGVNKGVLESWGLILDNWKTLEPFHQKQTKLVQINSNIQNILAHIKNGYSKNKTGNSGKTNAGANDFEIFEAVGSHFNKAK